MKIRYLLIAAAMLAAYGWVGSMDRADAERQQDQYCEMVELWEKTKGNSGWPPYKGEC